MKRIKAACIAAICLTGLVAGCGGEQKAAAPQAPVELTVSAAVSMKDALTEIQQAYQAKNPNVKLAFNFGASGALQKQIEEGAPADIFISAAVKQMDELAKKKLIKEDSRKDLLLNQLVLIAPKASALALTGFGDLAKAEVKQFAMGAPESVPAGQYTQQVLKKLGIDGSVQPKTVQAKDVRTVLAYVETGNVEAGAVYKTDALVSDKVKIIAAAPADSHAPIVYPMAVLAGTKQPAAAEAFAAFLRGAESKAIFEKYGFALKL